MRKITSESLQKVHTKFSGCRTCVGRVKTVVTKHLCKTCVGRVKTVVTKHLCKMFRSHTQGSRTQYCSQDKFW